MQDNKVERVLNSLRSTVYNLETLVQGTDDLYARSLCVQLNKQINSLEEELDIEEPEQ